MTPTEPGRALEPLSRAFLQAYWLGDLSAALARCTPTAVIELARSLPMVTPAPMAEVLPQIFANVYPKFEGGRFDVTIGGTLEQGNRVLVEYTARGRLVKGTWFECDYAAVFDFFDRSIARVRMYTDSHYLAVSFG